jgi:hypothetical protein
VSDDTPDNVLRPTFGQPSELGKQTDITRRGPYCFHRQYELDEGSKTVACGKCGAPLEAFQILLEYAHDERHWRHWDREATEKRKLLAELKAEEHKVKSRTASASRKDATAAVEHERQATLVRRQAIAEKARDIAELARQIAKLSRIETDVFLGGARRKREVGK